jgi:hypothetical protein
MHAVVSGSVFDPVFRDATGFLDRIRAGVVAVRIDPIAGIRDEPESLLHQSILGVFQRLESWRKHRSLKCHGDCSLVWLFRATPRVSRGSRGLKTCQ